MQIFDIMDKLEELNKLDYKEFMDILTIATTHLEKMGCIETIKLYYGNHEVYSYGYKVDLKHLWKFHILLKKEELYDD